MNKIETLPQKLGKQREKLPPKNWEKWRSSPNNGEKWRNSPNIWENM
jgi:hypothetical protein